MSVLFLTTAGPALQFCIALVHKAQFPPLRTQRTGTQRDDTHTPLKYFSAQ